jgi:hypothetical protein
MTKRTLRPLGLGDIFDEAFDLYKDNFLFLVLVVTAAAVPLQVALGLVEFRFLRDFHGLSGVFGGDLPDITQVFAMFGTIAGALALLAPLYAIGLGLQMTALASATSSRYLGIHSTLWDAYRVPLRRLGPLALSALLYGVFLALGACVCYVGIFVPLSLLAFSAHAFAVEDQNTWRFWRPLARSRSLALGQAGRVFGALCVMGIVYVILSLGIQLPLSYALHALLSAIPGAHSLFGEASGSRGSSAEAQVIMQIGDSVTELIVVPFLVCVLTVLYYDLRVRKEAFDLELLARDLRYPILPWVAPQAQRPRRAAPRKPSPAKGVPS